MVTKCAIIAAAITAIMGWMTLPTRTVVRGPVCTVEWPMGVAHALELGYTGARMRRA